MRPNSSASQSGLEGSAGFQETLHSRGPGACGPGVEEEESCPCCRPRGRPLRRGWPRGLGGLEDRLERAPGACTESEAPLKVCSSPWGSADGVGVGREVLAVQIPRWEFAWRRLSFSQGSPPVSGPSRAPLVTTSSQARSLPAPRRQAVCGCAVGAQGRQGGGLQQPALRTRPLGNEAGGLSRRYLLEPGPNDAYERRAAVIPHVLSSSGAYKTHSPHVRTSLL